MEKRIGGRRVVGWAMATHLRTERVLDALEMALLQRQPTAVIHHSDPAYHDLHCLPTALQDRRGRSHDGGAG